MRLLVLLLVGCSSWHGSSSVDPPAADADVDLGRDGGGPRASDSGADVETVADAGAPLDAARCECPPRPCHDVSCEVGSCTSRPWADGTACGEAGTHCVAGACVLQGCGDRFLEADELCDDGNDDPFDACRECAPQPFALEHRPGWFRTPRAALSGERVLVLALRDEAGVEHLEARRFDVHGVALGETIVLDRRDVGAISSPTVTATEGGWLVGWSVAEEGGALLRRVSFDGEPGPVHPLHDGVGLARELQLAPRLAVWLRRAPGDLAPSLETRVLDEWGRPSGDAMRLASGAAEARVAFAGDHYALAYLDRATRDAILIRLTEPAQTTTFPGPFQALSLAADEGGVTLAAAGEDTLLVAEATWSGEPTMETHEARTADLAVARSGRRVLAWRDEGGVVLQSDAPLPELLAAELAGPPDPEALALLGTDHATWVLWTVTGDAPDDRDLRAFLLP